MAILATQLVSQLGRTYGRTHADIADMHTCTHCLFPSSSISVHWQQCRSVGPGPQWAILSASHADAGRQSPFFFFFFLLFRLLHLSSVSLLSASSSLSVNGLPIQTSYRYYRPILCVWYRAHGSSFCCQIWSIRLKLPAQQAGRHNRFDAWRGSIVTWYCSVLF